MLVPNTRAQKDDEQSSQAKFLSGTDMEAMKLTVHCWVVECGGEVEQLNPPNVMDEEVILITHRASSSQRSPSED